MVRIKSTDRGIDWIAIASRLGTLFPDDYVDLANSYPSFVIDDFLSVHIPDRGDEERWGSGRLDVLAPLDSLWMSGMSQGYTPYPEPGGLIMWGDSCDGDSFYWRTTGDSPNSWTIVVAGANDDWSEFQGSLTDYLAGLITGDVAPYGLPPDFPGRTPAVDI
uniref:hypothetical protein n=1 Tax=Streptomyces virginiae TaxID=1961 RepID=UPI002F90D346